MWDFDPAESVKEKFGKLFEVKGVRGIRKLVKEIAVTAATGQHENELVGRAKIPLKVSTLQSKRQLRCVYAFFLGDSRFWYDNVVQPRQEKQNQQTGCGKSTTDVRF